MTTGEKTVDPPHGAVYVWTPCPVCGEELSVALDGGNPVGMTEATCSVCGTISLIDTHDGSGVSSTTSGLVEDIGQPRCDGSCGAEAAFVGTPCRWNCRRAVAWKKAAE